MQETLGKSLGALVLGLLLLLGLASCASYTSRLRDLRATAAGGGVESALRQVEKASKPGDLLYHLERGALLHYAGRHLESNAELLQAELLLEDLYTISASRRALTFLLNDEVEAYSGEVHEGNYLHYYRILNFLALGRPASAAVEARRLALRLSTLRDDMDRDPLLRDDPFLEYFAGAILEASGEWNEALISYRLASQAYADWEGLAGLAAHPWLAEDIGNAARMAGIDLESIPEIVSETPEPSGPQHSQARDEGCVLLLFECGWTPRKESVHLRLPIFTDDSNWEGEDGACDLGWKLADRYEGYRANGCWRKDGPKLAYFLDVAVPVLVDEPEWEAISCRIRAQPVGGWSPMGSGPGEPVLTAAAIDVCQLVKQAFARSEIAVLAKTFARALIKYTAHRRAEKELGTFAGLVTNLAGAATEKADTRSWLMLPGQIQMAKLYLPPGDYRMRLEALDATGRSTGTRALDLSVEPAGIQVITWRSFE